MSNPTILTDFEYRKLIGEDNEYEIVNPYIGCDYDCTYCFCRTIRDCVRQNTQMDIFHRSVICNEQFPKLLRASSGSRKVYIGTAVDPYPLYEPDYLVTRNILKTCVALKKEIVIATKSPLISRDIAYITSCPKSIVFISIASLKEKWFKLYEPKAPLVTQRISTIRNLSDNGVPAAVFIAPIIPGINDNADFLFEILDVCTNAGAKFFIVSTVEPTDISDSVPVDGWKEDMLRIFERLSQKAPYMKNAPAYINLLLGSVGMPSLCFLDDDRAFAVLREKHS